MKLLLSTNLDPYVNLAAEEYLMETQSLDEPILFLWQSRQTVVVGKHQNPWLECHLELLENEGGLLARRISGGGTVYQDEGNLNFSFLGHRDLYRSKPVYEIVLNALNQTGVQAELTGKNCLTVKGKKISGNSFCYKKQTAMHHGTLLVSADLEKLNRYLKGTDPAIKTKAIASIPAEVTNLVEVQKKMTINRMRASLIESFSAAYGDLAVLPWTDLDLENRIQKFSSWDWIYGHTPPFDYTGKNFSGRVEKGMISNGASGDGIQEVPLRRFNP